MIMLVCTVFVSAKFNKFIDNVIIICLHSGYYAASNFSACTDGQLHLVGGSSETEGRVEICYDDQWGTCMQPWLECTRCQGGM